jgi:hypothetical protein
MGEYYMIVSILKDDFTVSQAKTIFMPYLRTLKSDSYNSLLSCPKFLSGIHVLILPRFPPEKCGNDREKVFFKDLSVKYFELHLIQLRPLSYIPVTVTLRAGQYCFL